MPATNVPSVAKLYATPLSSLPLDVWFLIADYLPPYDLLYLSHTCKALRAVAGRRLPEDIRNLKKSTDCWHFVTTLAGTSLDHWACIACFQLHEVNLSDNPTRHTEVPPRKRCHRLQSYSYNDDDNATRFRWHTGKYEIKLKHVQLALKYKGSNRLGTLHRKHLEKLMEPFRKHVRDHLFGPTGLPPLHHTGLGDLMPMLDYRATPKVLRHDDVLKYIVHEEWKYKMPRLYQQNSPYMDSDESFLRLRHKVFGSSDCCKHQMPLLSTPVLDVHLKNLATRPLGQKTSFSCQKCPTDYDMWFERITTAYGREEFFVLHSWKDMRTSEDEWKRRIRWHYDVGDGPFVQDFTPGDARYLYENDGQLPPRTCVDVDEDARPVLPGQPATSTSQDDDLNKPPAIACDGDAARGSLLDTRLSPSSSRKVAPKLKGLGSMWQKIRNAVGGTIRGRRRS